MNKTASFISFFFIFIIYATACNPKHIPKNTIFIILESSPNSLDPRKATDATGMRLSDLLFRSLVKYDSASKLKPDLAFKWQLTGLVYTFYLKSNMRFSNGRLINKQDILFSFQEFQKKTSVFYSAFKNIKKVQVLKQKSLNKHVKSETLILKVFLKKFQASFLYSDIPVIKILPKQEILANPKAFQKNLITSGDFSLESASFHEILLKRRVQSKTLAQFLSFQIIRDSFTRTQKMLSGESDLAPSVIPLQKINQFKRQKNKFQVISSPGLSTSYLLVNLKNKHLKNKKLRQAISLSIDREKIIKYKMHGYAVPAKSFTSPVSYFFNKNMHLSKWNLKLAKQIIYELGLQKLALKLSLSNNPSSVNIARVLMSQISQTGLKISIQSNEWGSFYKNVGQGIYELALMKWVGVRDPDIYRVAFHSENLAPRGRNRSFYKNKNLDKILDQALIIKNPNQRKHAYNKIQNIIAKNMIVIPLWHNMEVSIIKKLVKNYTLRTNGDFLSLANVSKQ